MAIAGPAPLIGIDTQNIVGLGSPMILFVPNPHMTSDPAGLAGSPPAPVQFYPLYPHFTWTDYIGGYTPLVRRNSANAGP